MKTFNAAGAQQATVSTQDPARDTTSEQAIIEVRPLEDWELALAGGGEGMVCW